MENPNHNAESNQNTPEALFAYLRDILYNPQEAKLDVEQLGDEYTKLGQGLMLLDRFLKELEGFVTDISRGNFAVDPPSNRQNPLLHSHKNLHATLRHLTWQSKQVANGDYSQRVDYLGEFGEAFNEMTRQLARRQKKLEDQVTYDDLTGIYNRFQGMKILTEWLDEKRHFVIAFLDLDYLKYINDTFGHAEGDKYILAAAQAFEIMPEGTVACRLGGDEFMLMIPDISENDANALMERYQHTLQKEAHQSGMDYEYGMSVGVVEVDADNDLMSGQVLHAVDVKMYENKRARKAQRQQKYERIGEAR